MNNEKRDKAYNDYVKTVTPRVNLCLACVKAFVMGGIICTFGQFLINLLVENGASKNEASLYAMIILIFISVVLTGLNIYPRLAKWGGAGTLVPITGFANSVASPALEFEKEGLVFGLACKIFTISGPVILYGILSSALIGLVYWIVR